MYHTGGLRCTSLFLAKQYGNAYSTVTKKCQRSGCPLRLSYALKEPEPSEM